MPPRILEQPRDIGTDQPSTPPFAEMLAEWPEEDVERFAQLLNRFAQALAALAERPGQRPASHIHSRDARPPKERA